MKPNHVHHRFWKSSEAFIITFGLLMATLVILPS
jgi:hypothetical protein